MPPAMFLLDRSKRYYFTCCGCLHVQMAMLFIICLVVIADVFEFMYYLFEDGQVVSVLEIIAEVVEYIITATLVIAFYRQSAILLIPFMMSTLLGVCLLMITEAQLIFSIIAPYSETANMFLGGQNHLGFFIREMILLFILAVMTTFTTFFVWMLHVTMLCYRYYQDKDAERKSREARLPVENPRPPLVQPSIVNPNFSIDDDEDNVFEKKPNGPQFV